MKIEQAIEILKELRYDVTELESCVGYQSKAETYYKKQIEAITTILKHIDPPKADEHGNLTVDEMIEVHKPTMTLKHEAMIKIKR